LKNVGCEYTCGDLDGSGGNVDMGDFAELSRCWGVNPTVDTDCICANLVEFDNRIIDLLDLQVLAELYLSTSSNYQYNCSTSIIDPYPPTPDPMSFETAPYATDGTAIEMTAANAKDLSGVEYYFSCLEDTAHDSGWQLSINYKDIGLSLDTQYTYTVKARDKSTAQNETSVSSAASATTLAYSNLVLPAHGGVLESFTSEYGTGWGSAANLTNEITDEDGWCNVDGISPEPEQEFVYSFRGGNFATLNEAVIHGGTAEDSEPYGDGYYSKDVEVWTSVNGTTFTLAGSDTLLEQENDSVTIDLGGIVAKKIKLVITSGYDSDYWEMAEFVVNGRIEPAAVPIEKAWWQLEDPDQTSDPNDFVAIDSSGNGYDGRLVGNPNVCWGQGFVDGGLYLPNSSNYFVETSNIIDPSDGQFSVFAWVKGGGSDRTILSQGNGSNPDKIGQRWLYQSLPSGNLTTSLNSDVGSELESSTDLTDGQWHHVGIVFDGFRRRLYVDNVLAVEDSADMDGSIKPSDGIMLIGADKTEAPSRMWEGHIDDVRIYETALIEAQIDMLYNGTLGQ
jgi:hypothetical protein